MTTIDIVKKTSTSFYGAGTTKRSTRSEMELRRTTLIELAAEAQPCSVRHLYYRAVVAGIVEKKETGYRKVQREVLRMRTEGRMPFEWIVDEGRRAHWPLTSWSPRSALHTLADTYRRDPWQSALLPRVEIWCESESIAGTLMPLKDEYAVPIFPVKGQASDSYLWEAAKSYYRSTVVLYAGDYDPAGLMIASQVEGKLKKYATDAAAVEFRVVAITHDHAADDRLQVLGTPPKQHHWVDYDGARHEFHGQAIEAEALAPVVMRQLFADAITKVVFDAVGYDIFGENRVLEVGERDRLADLARGWGQ